MEPKEIWKDIPEYAGYYQASNLWRIRSLDREITQKANGGNTDFTYIKNGRILAQGIQKGGYPVVSISVEAHRKICTVHRLVASAFIDNPENLRDVNHKDGNKKNNNVSNLEWVKHSDNIKHSYRQLHQKRYDKPVRCVETGIVYESCEDASRKTGINRGGINHVINGIAMTAGGFTWERI